MLSSTLPLGLIRGTCCVDNRRPNPSGQRAYQLDFMSSTIIIALINIACHRSNAMWTERAALEGGGFPCRMQPIPSIPVPWDDVCLTSGTIGNP